MYILCSYSQRGGCCSCCCSCCFLPLCYRMLKASRWRTRVRKSTTAHWQLPAGLDPVVLRTVTFPRVSRLYICIWKELCNNFGVQYGRPRKCASFATATVAAQKNAKHIYSFWFPGSNSTLGNLCMWCLWILRYGMGWMGSRWQEVTILGAICAKWSRSRLELWSVSLESWPRQVDTAMPLVYWPFELRYTVRYVYRAWHGTVS